MTATISDVDLNLHWNMLKIFTLIVPFFVGGGGGGVYCIHVRPSVHDVLVFQYYGIS